MRQSRRLVLAAVSRVGLPERRHLAAVLGVMCLLLLAAPAMAQLGSSGIAGVVKDATGAVLPGVTVEAASPALIEKVRTVVSDGEGQYKIVSLSPGTYSVTFTLPGFGSVKREGIDLASNFTATINAELKVGDIAETVTVSGQSPVVDIQNTSVRNLIRQEILDAIPTNKTLGAWAALTPGMVVPGTSMDVGGSKGEQSLRLAIHGGHGGEQRMLVDGMNTSGGGSDFGYIPNPASAQDVSLELGAGTAEAMLGGVLINFIPKDGGNRFSGLFSGNFANHTMQASNLSDEVKARGLTELSVNKVHDIWEYNGTLGGPIVKDRLWFFTAHRRWGNSTQVAGIFHNATQDGWVFTPDYSRPGYSDYLQRSQSIRLTWQASTRNKVRLFFDYQNHCDCHRGLDTGSAGNGTPTAPEAAHYRKYFPNNVPQASWSFPATSKLLFEAGVSARIFIWTNMPEPGVTANTISITESSNNFLYHAAPNYGEHLSTQANQRFAVSYITGSHAFKTGLFVLQEWRRQTDDPNLGVTYQFRNGRPTQLTQFVVPTKEWDRINPDLGLYGQDQWTIKRLTLNLGVRFDYLKGYVPAQHLPAGPFVPARDYAPVNCVPCWKDLSPRLSAAYDLFGNAKTAVKVSFGRYVGQQSAVGIPSLNNPVQTTVKSATRAWTDANNDFIPQESELGPLSNSNFGKNTVATTLLARCAAWIWRPGLQLADGCQRPARAVSGCGDDAGVFSHHLEQLPRNGQPPGDAVRLRSVLHHGACRHSATRRWRKPAMRSLQHHPDEIQLGEQPRGSGEQFRQADRDLQRHGSDSQCTVASQCVIEWRAQYRAHGDFQLRHRRFAAASIVLRRQSAVPASFQAERCLSVAVGHAGERAVSEQSGCRHHCQLRRHQRAGPAVTRPPALWKRKHCDDREHLPAADRVRGTHQSARCAVDEDL